MNVSVGKSKASRLQMVRAALQIHDVIQFNGWIPAAQSVIHASSDAVCSTDDGILKPISIQCTIDLDRDPRGNLLCPACADPVAHAVAFETGQKIPERHSVCRFDVCLAGHVSQVIGDSSSQFRAASEECGIKISSIQEIVLNR